MKTLFQFLIILSLFSSGCIWMWTKPRDTLPPATQEGAETLGFTFEDGTVWVRHGSPGRTIMGPGALECGYESYWIDSALYLDVFISAHRYMRNEGDTLSDLYIAVSRLPFDDFSQELTLDRDTDEAFPRGLDSLVAPHGYASFSTSIRGTLGPLMSFQTDSLHPATLRFTAIDTVGTDSTAGFLAGLFEMSLYSEAEDSTLHILDGRFDAQVDW